MSTNARSTAKRRFTWTVVARKMVLLTCWFLFSSILGVFGWILGTPGLTMGAHWVLLDYIVAAGVTFGACKLHFGRSWELLDSILSSLGGPGASKMYAAGDLADIAKTHENHCFSMVLKGWRVNLEAWTSSGLSCWHTGLQKVGWLDGWLEGQLATGTS